MKTLNLNSAINPLARRAGLLELRGHSIPLPGVASSEPLLRGCDQRQWLERLVRLGLRHLVIPLNGPEEDTCVFARRHPGWGIQAALPGELPPRSVPARASRTVFDLEHRDEGLFARLQFLLDAADAIGVMIGISLFHASPAAATGPLTRRRNVQGLAFDDLLPRRTGVEAAARIEATLAHAVEWVAGQVRGRRAVWVEVFRGVPREKTSEPLRRLEHNLTRRLAQAVGPAPRLSPHPRAAGPQGPWIVPPPDFGRFPSPVVAQAVEPAHAGWTACATAPFDLRRGVAGQDEPLHRGESSPQQPRLFYVAMPETRRAQRAASLDRAALWRTCLYSGWPIIPGGFSQRTSLRRWRELAQVAAFARQWVGRCYLRPCPELLAPLPAKIVSAGKVTAATDGCGRYFAYFADGWTRSGGVTWAGGAIVATLPGPYRYYWFDLATGQSTDHGDGLSGGRRCNVPALDSDRETMLILEQEELPDPLSVW